MQYFGCTACGKCCDRGPEVELSETLALSRHFIFRLLFKLHSVPKDHRSEAAMSWWKAQGSLLPVRKAIEEASSDLSSISVHESGGSHLTISAIAMEGRDGSCPSLSDGACGIYEIRPMSCRTVPFHYSRSDSTLARYLGDFVRTPGYRCDSAAGAPVVVDAGRLVDQGFIEARRGAVALRESDRAWRAAIAEAMGRDKALPSYDMVEKNQRAGATSAPILPAWRIAVERGLISPSQFRAACRNQRRLIGRRMLKDLFATLSSRPPGRPG